MNSKRELARGALWRQWDLLAHTPASYHWRAQKFEGDLSSEPNRKLADEMIQRINAAQAAVFGIADHGTFDGYLALQRRLQEPGVAALTKTVLPGIRLRLAAPITSDVVILFSEEAKAQRLQDFISALNLDPVAASAGICPDAFREAMARFSDEAIVFDIQERVIFARAEDTKPRLAISVSNAHSFAGYGDFPPGQNAWIKADPSFRGLKQAVLEPAKRAFIGEKPPKLWEVEANKTYYIDSLEVGKTADKAELGQWLDGCDLPLNPDLVAIIGNKGSGKSALADVIALLGNSRQSKHFSFLKKERFLGRSGEPARHFRGTLTWRDDSTESRALNEFPPEEKAELVRYIPQGYFEELCNEYISGKSNAFEKELSAVIFSHTSETLRLGALDFDQLTEQQEQSLRNQLGEYRKELSSINASIVRIEEQLQPTVLEKLSELLLLKIKQLEEHEKLKPPAVAEPAKTLDLEQQQAAASLKAANQALEAIKQRRQEIAAKNARLAKQQKAIADIRERLRLLQRAFEQARQGVGDSLEELGLTWADLAHLEIRMGALDEKTTQILAKQNESEIESGKLDAEQEALATRQQSLAARLDEPQRQFAAYCRRLADWDKKRAELNGSPTEPDTRMGLQTRIAQLKDLPAALKELEKQRLNLSGEIFAALNAQRQAREKLFEPVQELIQKNSLIREDYRLQFQATLTASADAIGDQLFGLIKQTWGDFRGQDEALSTIRKLFDRHDLNARDGALSFVMELQEKIAEAARASGASVGIFSLVKKGQTASSVYDLLFGLNFLQPRYSLLFQDARIEQLSPGQRGALLLIFYLLVDKGRTPIILDQPEENLDNETVFRLLVPVLSEGKKRRQIIMVTHNPNLADRKSVV